MRPYRLLLPCLLLLPSPAPAGESVDYLRDVKPILRERCHACHGPLKQKSRLRLDTAVLARKGGAGGPAIEPGKPADSPLIERVTARDEGQRMPPEGAPLTPRQVEVLRAWIEQGAKGPTGERPAEDPRQHWAFQKPVRPAVPPVKNAAWLSNPIDAFIAAGHEQHALTPAPPADPAVLLRRVYLDLVGLPPTREELHAFLADPSPAAYERTVDRLLASPRHAERWARHWMDVWRYSDWYGSRHINELRNSRRHIWRWRDWLIESLEKDAGYDRLVLEMLAADELAPGDRNAQRASGYLGRNFYVFNRHVWLQDTAEYAAASLLGLTLKCCRCHDHKYDPLSHEDYYRFRAFFEPHGVRTDPLPGKTALLKAHFAEGSPPGSNLADGLDCVYDANLAAPTYLLERGNDKYPRKDRPLTPGVPAVLGGKLPVEPVKLPVEAYYPELRPANRAARLAEARSAVAGAEAELAKARKAPLAERQSAVRLAEKKRAALVAALAALEARTAAELAKYAQSPDPASHRLALAASKAEREANLRQAEYEVAQDEQEVTAAQVLAAAEKKLAAARARLEQMQKTADAPSPSYTPLGPVYPATSSGRRLALARWMVSRDNPLTARVAVNHVWLRHVGSALVPSVNNFGLNGKRPTHPELLDWLAVEFMEHGWSLKHLHRLIVTSNTYRLASDARASAGERGRAADPENRWLWRANVRRMEAEVVRDSLLHLASRLDVSRGGPDLDPAKDHVTPRRSLYFRHTPDEKPLLLEVFDAANPSECFERTESVVPQQALALANSDFCRAQARLVARRLAAVGQPSDEAFLVAAFEHVLARTPTPEERQSCLTFLREQRGLFTGKGSLPAPAASAPGVIPPSADPAGRARENLVHVLLNYNEFVTIR
jgi:mono/diheme cytochrome c family protein